MAEGRRNENWDTWAEMLALTANCHRDPKKSKAFEADKIHPYRRHKRRQRQGVGVRGLFAVMRARYGGFKSADGGDEEQKPKAPKNRRNTNGR